MNKTDGRNVFLGGEIDEEKVQEAMENITALHEKDEKKWITLYLNSGGGAASTGLAFYEYITTILRPKKLQIVLLGRASSIALIVFLSAERKNRYMGKYSYIALHNTSHIFDKETVVEAREQREDADNLERLNKWYKEIIMKRANSKLTKKKLGDLMDNHKYVVPEEAVRIGIAHKIL